jgi:hypothetical protein
MKRIIHKIHHFTKKELAIEEILIITVMCVLGTGALAAKVLMPIRAHIVQCGEREDLSRSCREDARCCALLEQAGGAAMSLSPAPASRTIQDMPPSGMKDTESYIHDEKAARDSNVE